jgi:hypothetical protein
MPPAARQALGLTPKSATASVSTLAGKPSPDVGLAYPDTPVEAGENVARLSRADLGGAPLLQARLDPVAWNDASLRWLIDPGRPHIAAKDINRRIAAEISWSRTYDRSARTRPARQKFLQRFEREVDPNGVLPPDERRRRAEHAKRAYMLRLVKRAINTRKRG